MAISTEQIERDALREIALLVNDLLDELDDGRGFSVGRNTISALLALLAEVNDDGILDLEPGDVRTHRVCGQPMRSGEDERRVAYWFCDDCHTKMLQ